MTFFKLLTAAGIAMLATPVLAQTVSIGTSPQGSASYLTGAAVAKLIDEATDLQPRVIPEGGSEVSLTRINNGDLDFAIATTPPLAQAWAGGKEYNDTKQENIRVIAVLRTLRTALMVRADSDIKSVKDIPGKRVADGFARIRAAALMLDAKLAAAGISKDDLVLVPVPTGGRAVDDLVAGRLDVTSFSLTSAKTREAHAAVGIRFISVPNTPEAVAAASASLPGSFIETVEPSDRFPGVTEAINVLSSKYVLTTRADMDEQTVYAITKALHDNKQIMVDAYAPMAEFEPDNMHPDVGVPYHDGALKFYKELGN